MADETEKGKKASLLDKFYTAFSRVEKLGKLQRLGICLLSLVLIGGGYYYFFYMPKSDALDRAEKEFKTQSQKLRTVRNQAKSLKKWEAKMAEVEEAFYLAAKELPEKKELPSLLRGVSKAGSNAGLTFLLFQPNQPVNREFYLEIPLSLEVQGQFHQIADFFFQVSRLNRIVNMINITMNKSGKSPGTISMRCSAATYMFVDAIDTGNKKKG